MSAHVETIVQLDAAEKYTEMMEYVSQSGVQAGEVVYATYALIDKLRFKGAYILSKCLETIGMSNFVVSFAQAAGGLMFNNVQDEQIGIQSLRDISAVLDDTQLTMSYKKILEPAVRQLTGQAITQQPSHQAVLRVLKILEAGAPVFKKIFDWDVPVKKLDVDAARKAGQAKARLVEYQSPPADTPRIHRNAVVAIRELIYPNQTWSRPFDMGPRITASMQAYGWDTTFYGIQFANLFNDFTAIINMCAEKKADVLILDDHIIEATYALEGRAQMIALLRQALPNIKIVGVHFDAWALDPDALTKESLLLDLIWDATSPSMPVWDRPEFFTAAGHNRVLHTQHPHAYQIKDATLPLQDELFFSGGIKGYNWHRAYWMAASTELNLPIRQRLASHADDGLPALDSYHVYMDGLVQATSTLNFSMRSDLARIVTGRCFEGIVCGTLLIQEETPDMDYYFVSGEHYLEFTTLSELRSIINFIRDNKDEAEEIRRRGVEFAKQRYSDDKIVGYIDYCLHYR
jgi:hypothetical protein